MSSFSSNHLRKWSLISAWRIIIFDGSLPIARQVQLKLLAMVNTPQSLPSCCFGLFTMVTRKGLVLQPNHLWIVWYVPSSRVVYTQSNTLTSPGTPCIVVPTIQWSTQEWMTYSMHALALKPCEWDWYKIDCNPSRFRNCNRNTVWA